MKKTTKILSLILSVLTLLSVFSAATPVFAEEVTELTSENAENVDDVIVSSEETETEETEEAEIVSEIEDMRTEHTKYFRMSDGSYMAAQYAQPIHYEENGKWKEYDYSITEDKNADETEKFVIENSDSEMSFPEEFSEDNEAQIEVSAREYDIKFSPVIDKKIFNNKEKPKGKVKNHKHLKSNEIIEEFTEEAPIDESTDKNAEKLKIDNQKSAIAYEEVYDNVDLEYEISSNKIKESIVLNSKQDKNKFEFTVDTDGLFPKKETDGSITLYEDKECTKPVSSIMKPYMYDAKGEYSYDVTMDIKEKKGAYILTVKASNKWLNDKARKYPVVIDPTITLDVGRTNTTDCYADDDQPNTPFPNDYYIYAGHSTLGKTRAFVKFKLPAIPDKCSVITNASIHFIQKSADVSSTPGYLNLYNITSDWDSSSVTWNKQPTVNKNLVLDYAKIVFGAGVQYSFDITKTVKEWYQGGTNYGLMLASANESVVNRTQLYSSQNYTADIYPQITVSYLNNKGIEDYWSYSSYSNGAAGAAYINDYTGNLVYALPILSSVSDLMPLNLVAYYNTYSANVKLNVGKSNSSRTTVAKGFRLNVQQTVLSSTLYGLGGDEAKRYPYVYTDGDGTEHYIEKTTEDGKTVYKAENNEDITLSLTPDINCTYQIKFKGGTSYYFNAKGNLIIMQDANGNRITISYKESNPTNGLEEKTRISKITDGAGHTFTFSYYPVNGVESDYIKTITDNAKRTVEFYTTSGFLRTVTYMDKTKTNLYYQLESTEGLLDYVQDNDGYGLNFDYTPKSEERKIKQVCEYINANGSNTIAQRITFDRTNYNKTVIRTAGVDGYHYVEDDQKGKDDIITTIQFDNTGKAISQQVSLGSGTEIGAGMCSYTNEATGVGEQNKISSSASLGKTVANLATNIGAETTGSWTGVTTNAIATQGISTEQSYVGKKSFKLSNSSLSNAKGGSYYRQGVTGLTGGETYTFSAYVKVTSLSSLQSSNIAGASLALVSTGSTNNITLYSSEKLTTVTDTTINNGWRRLSVTMTLPSDATGINLYLELRSVVGTAYFDNIQLESGSVANTCNLIENSSFEKQTSNLPTSWSKAGDFEVTTNSSGAVLDGSSTSAHKNGARCLRIDGEASKSKGICQTVVVAPNENDTYIVSGWGAAYAVNDTCHNGKTKFEIAVRVTYTRTKMSDNTKDTVTQYKDSAVFNTTISGWQYSVSSFSLKYAKPESDYTYTPTHILIVPRYCYQENYAYFDHIQLIKDSAQTYTYDDKGNLVSTVANSEQHYNMEYDDNDNLTSYTDAAGYKTTATYDDNHNLLTTKSPRGVVTKNSYYDNGMVKTTEIQNSAGTASIKTESTLELFSERALVFSTFDQHGYETIYGRDEDTGIITDIKTPDDVVTYYEYDDSFTKLKKVTTAGTSVAYTYSGNRLTDILFSGTDNKTENYSFTFTNIGQNYQTKVGKQVLATNTYYPNNGPLKTKTYGNNDKITYNYNNLGLVSSIIKTDVEPNKSNVTSNYSWTYTSTGVTQSHTDAVNKLKYLYDYDSLGRLIRQEIQNSSNSTHVGSVEFGYDVRNNLTKVATEIGGFTAIDEYLYSKDSGNANATLYAKDNLISRYKIAGTNTRYVDYTYDSLNRLSKKSLALNGKSLVSSYTYAGDVKYSGDYTTNFIETEKLDNTTYKYYYDCESNIKEIEKNSKDYLEYKYDLMNQLTREINHSEKEETGFTYDDLGNITSKVEYDYTTKAVNKTIKYRYESSSSWNHILTGVNLNGDTDDNGEPVYDEATEIIKYDSIGNPTTYLGASLKWNGRQLTSYTKDSTSVSYTYDVDGLRATKDNNGEKSTYCYVGDQLRYEARGEKRFYYFYDATGSLTAIGYYPNATSKLYMYYILTNSRGDVVGIYNGSGTLLASYEYDAWGNIISVKDGSGETISPEENNIANLNPIRYRGYYYDTETGLYYLQSRYYNPQVGRFLNADNIAYLGVEGTPLSYNLFSYCTNNPVNKIDSNGHAPKWWQSVLIGVAVIAVVSLVTAAIVSTGGAAAVLATAGNVALGALKIAATSGIVSGTIRTGKSIAGGESNIKELGKDFVVGFADGFKASALYSAGCTGVSMVGSGISGQFNNGCGWKAGLWEGGYQTPNTHGISIATHHGGINGGRSFGVDIDVYNGAHYHTNKFGTGKRSSWIKTHHWGAGAIFVGAVVGFSEAESEW